MGTGCPGTTLRSTLPRPIRVMQPTDSGIPSAFPPSGETLPTPGDSNGFGGKVLGGGLRAGLVCWGKGRRTETAALFDCVDEATLRLVPKENGRGCDRGGRTSMVIRAGDRYWDARPIPQVNWLLITWNPNLPRFTVHLARLRGRGAFQNTKENHDEEAYTVFLARTRRRQPLRHSGNARVPKRTGPDANSHLPPQMSKVESVPGL